MMISTGIYCILKKACFWRQARMNTKFRKPIPKQTIKVVSSKVKSVGIKLVSTRKINEKIPVQSKIRKPSIIVKCDSSSTLNETHIFRDLLDEKSTTIQKWWRRIRSKLVVSTTNNLKKEDASILESNVNNCNAIKRRQALALKARMVTHK
jgi:hypothetical protein